MPFLNEERWAEASQLTRFFHISESCFILRILWDKLLSSRSYSWEKRGSDVTLSGMEVIHLLNSPSLFGLFLHNLLLAGHSPQASFQISLLRGAYRDYSIQNTWSPPSSRLCLLFIILLSISLFFHMYLLFYFQSLSTKIQGRGPRFLIQGHIPVGQQRLTSSRCSKMWNR